MALLAYPSRGPYHFPPPARVDLQSMGDKITDDEFATMCKEAGIADTVSYDQFQAVMNN